jgi:predicted transcriptional regulator
MPDDFKQLLEKVMSERAPGPSPSFSVFHLLHAIELMAKGTIGRNKLARSLNVGEGTARTIISRLKSAGLIVTSKAGCTLTSKGSKLLMAYRSIFEKKVEIGKNELTLANCNFAILIKNRGHLIKSGVEQRDAAIMAGARGATTIMFKEGRLRIPSVSDDVAKDFPNAANQIVRLLEPRENDVMIIGSADSLGKAEYGTLAAAWTVLDN